MPADRFVEQLNVQIEHEFAAHQQYVACAVFYDALTMPQMAGFFYAPVSYTHLTLPTTSRV